MAFENIDAEQPQGAGVEPPPGGEATNRTFLIVAGILGGVTVLALACIAAYAFVILPRQRAQASQQVASLNARNTQVALAITQTSAAAYFTATPTATKVPPTATRTPTKVVVAATNTKVLAAVDPRTATVSALLTQASGIQRTKTVAPTATALPKTGFAEDVGLPGMLGTAITLIAVFFLARRLRMSS